MVLVVQEQPPVAQAVCSSLVAGMECSGSCWRRLVGGAVRRLSCERAAGYSDREWPLVEQSAAECGSAMQLAGGVARLDRGKVLTSY